MLQEFWRSVGKNVYSNSLRWLYPPRESVQAPGAHPRVHPLAVLHPRLEGREPRGVALVLQVQPGMRPRHITLSEPRSRLYRCRSLQVNSHFAAFFKICKIFTILRRSNLKILQKLVKNFMILKKILQISNFCKFSSRISWFWRNLKFFKNFRKFKFWQFWIFWKFWTNFSKILSSERCKSVQIL